MKLLTQNIVGFKATCVFFILLFFSSITNCIAKNSIENVLRVGETNISTVSSTNFYSASKKKYVSISNDSLQRIKILVKKSVDAGDAEKAVLHAKKYLGATGDMSIINDHVFANIKDSPIYLAFKTKYEPKLSFTSLLYIYAGFLGLFVFVILNVKKTKDKVSTLLISLFVLFHSVFILHLSLYVINVQYYMPQALFVSTTFSFLYGPLLYFYFKRVIYNYKFKVVDLLHLVPSIVLFIYILPYYLMTNLEKFNVIYDQNNLLLPGANVIITVKILSLSVYAFLILRMYNEQKKDTVKESRKPNYCWQRNLIVLHCVYLVSYVIYAGTITELIPYPSLFHLQILVMVSVVFYVAYIAYAQPEVFKGEIKLMDPIGLFKYKKSGLTPSFSSELKYALLKLLNEDKIYKENNLNLENLSIKLGTTRHNTSQVINEHFNMSFSELMNAYRIDEATEILKNDDYNNLNIIQVAYEVGFNNKVSFNKSFKKHHELTPSQYIKSFRA